MARSISAETVAIISFALEAWEKEFRPLKITPTVRQYFYILATANFVEKDDKGYGRVQRTLASAREKGLFPWEAVWDELRQLREVLTWSGLPDFWETVRCAYKRDFWETQPCTVEVWVEKDALRGTVGKVIDEYRVPFLVNRGYCSLSAKKQSTQRIATKPHKVFYIGDHDPSGLDMQRELEKWIGEYSDSVDFELIRLAITNDDHADQTLGHLPVNLKDTRSKNYVRQYGASVVEAEALRPTEIQKRLREAIKRVIDVAVWNYALDLEAKEQDEIEHVLEGVEAA